jgi:hypothetical protein
MRDRGNRTRARPLQGADDRELVEETRTILRPLAASALLLPSARNPYQWTPKRRLPLGRTTSAAGNATTCTTPCAGQDLRFEGGGIVGAALDTNHRSAALSGSSVSRDVHSLSSGNHASGAPQGHWA